METRAWFQCYGNKVSHDVQNDLSRSLRELGISLLPEGAEKLKSLTQQALSVTGPPGRVTSTLGRFSERHDPVRGPSRKARLAVTPGVTGQKSADGVVAKRPP
jgi:hypothetical protein